MEAKTCSPRWDLWIAHLAWLSVRWSLWPADMMCGDVWCVEKRCATTMMVADSVLSRGESDKVFALKVELQLSIVHARPDHNFSESVRHVVEIEKQFGIEMVREREEKSSHPNTTLCSFAAAVTAIDSLTDHCNPAYASADCGKLFSP